MERRLVRQASSRRPWSRVGISTETRGGGSPIGHRRRTGAGSLARMWSGRDARTNGRWETTLPDNAGTAPSCGVATDRWRATSGPMRPSPSNRSGFQSGRKHGSNGAPSPSRWSKSAYTSRRSGSASMAWATVASAASWSTTPGSNPTTQSATPLVVPTAATSSAEALRTHLSCSCAASDATVASTASGGPSPTTTANRVADAQPATTSRSPSVRSTQRSRH